MNSLSWLIYWADVLPSLGEALTIFGVIFSLVSALAFKVMLVCELDGHPLTAGEVKTRTFTAAVFIISVPLFFTGLFLPSRNTIMLIAASEMGEEALELPEADKARRALNAWLDQYLHKDAGQ